MLLTVYQKHILEILAEIPYIRHNQLLWLMRLKFGTEERQLTRELRQLCYLGRITMQVDRGGIIMQPRCRRDDRLLAAMDIMMEVCGNSLPEIIKGEPPCKLSFYIKDERGYLDFKIIPVPLGEEQRICTMLLSQYSSFVCTYLFLPESEGQIERLSTEKSAYFVFPDGKGGWRFLKKQN